MDRKDFFKMLGVNSAAGLATVCLASCNKEKTSGNYPGPSNVNFSLDLTATQNAALNNGGGYVYSNGVIVAKTLAGAYIAVSQACTHQGVTVTYNGPNKTFYCPSHAANYSETGTVLGGPPNVPLTQYQTALSGTMLRVFS